MGLHGPLIAFSVEISTGNRHVIMNIMIIVILGQTAVGKSALALELAQKLGAEIISADSMQVYRGMDIGTAKPSKKEQKLVPHHLIDIRNPDEEWTVSDFVSETTSLATQLPSRPATNYIIVGGTGLYLWSLINGYTFPKVGADKDIRERLEKLPTATLYSQLSTIDPASAKRIHPNNKKRIVRALEIYEITGKPVENTKEEPSRRYVGAGSKIVGLSLPREILYQLINERVDKMIGLGLIDEVKGLLAKGYAKNLPAFQALGYKEVIEYLDGQWDQEKMVYELKKRTRHFARRQQTWFKRFDDAKWFTQPVDTKAILDYISK